MPTNTVNNKLQNATARVKDAPFDLLAIVFLKFVVATFAASIAYFILVIFGEALLVSGLPTLKVVPTSFGDPTTLIRDSIELIKTEWEWLVWITSPSLVAALGYLYTPVETVDWYHKAGKLFALFLPINLVLSAEFIIYNYPFQEMFAQHQVGPITFILAFSIASIALPAAYGGALIAARWARNEKRAIASTGTDNP